MSEKLIRIQVNPLKILEWDPVFQPLRLAKNPEPERLLELLCSLGVPSDMSAFRKRYVEVTKYDKHLPLVVEEPAIRENLSGPLRQAKMNYILGNYLASIALCGIVAEKVAILIHNKDARDETERERFNELRQTDRIKSLKKAGLINEKSSHDFHNIRKTRTSFLHYWNTLQERSAQRAVQVYAATTRLVSAAIGVSLVNGKVILDHKLMEYLENQGAILRKADDK